MKINQAKIKLEGISRQVIRDLRLLSGKSITATVLKEGASGDLVMLRFGGRVFEARLDGISIRLGQSLKLKVEEYTGGKLVLRLLNDSAASVDGSKLNISPSLPFPMKGSFLQAFFTFVTSVLHTSPASGLGKKGEKGEWIDLLSNGGMDVDGAIGQEGMIQAIHGDEEKSSGSPFRLALGEVENRRAVVIRIPTRSMGDIGALIALSGNDHSGVSITLWNENNRNLEILNGELDRWSAALREFIPGLEKITILRKEEIGELEIGREWLS